MDRWVSITKISVIALLLVQISVTPSRADSKQWANPFPDRSGSTPISDSLTFEMVLMKVAQENRSLEALELEKGGVVGLIRQAGLRPNPELELETEEFGGGLPGFSQSEWSLSLSQELELWGRRKARIREAGIEVESRNLEAGIAAFEIYAATSRKFIELAHAQTEYELVRETRTLAGEMVEAARNRVEKGAAHISELNMAELELARAEINLGEAEVSLNNARQALAVLWDGGAEEVRIVISSENDVIIPAFDSLKNLIDDSREPARMKIEREGLLAGVNMAIAEARPSPTFRAGIKRLEADDVNTFLVGVSLPLPIFNRNQGRQRAMLAQSSALDLELQQSQSQTESELRAIYQRLQRLETTSVILEQKLIPQAETAFQALKDAYGKGKLSYLGLLEGERTLLELRHEWNDILLEKRYQIISVEEMLGIRLM